MARMSVDEDLVRHLARLLEETGLVVPSEPDDKMCRARGLPNVR